jgi:hypothetical protein
MRVAVQLSADGGLWDELVDYVRPEHMFVTCVSVWEWTRLFSIV